MLIPPPDDSTVYVDKNGQPTRDLYNWIRSLFFELSEARPRALTVAELPPGYAGQRRFVTDALPPNNFGTVVSGGGSNKVPVYFDGVDWRIG